MKIFRNFWKFLHSFQSFIIFLYFFIFQLHFQSWKLIFFFPRAVSSCLILFIFYFVEFCYFQTLRIKEINVLVLFFKISFFVVIRYCYSQEYWKRFYMKIFPKFLFRKKTFSFFFFFFLICINAYIFILM